MRVLWVFDILLPTLQQLANRLADEPGIELEIMARWDGAVPAIAPAIRLTNLTCRHKLDLAARQRIREKVRTGKYDIVHAYTSTNLANVIAACRGLRPMPRIVGYRGAIKPLRLLDPANWITFWHPRLTKTICVSKATELALRNSGISQSKLAAVLEGCDPDNLPRLPRSARGEFDIPRGAFVVGTVANMRRGKGIDLLLQAALQLSDLSNVYYLLIGEARDPLLATLAADPRIANRVRWAGPRPNGAQYMGLFDVYACPSRMEGMGIAVIEAMVQKVCPLVTNVGGLPELVRHEREGLIVPTEDSAALADAIRRLERDPALRMRLGEAAYRRGLHEFSVAAWKNRLMGVYRDLLGQPALRAAG